MQGLRVLAMAYKEIINIPTSRAECEEDLITLGLAVLENNLKEDTKDVVDSLQRS